MSISCPGVEGEERVPQNASSSEPPGPGPDPHPDLPLLDSEVLKDMEEQLGGPEIPGAFARDYASLWDQRQGNLVAAMDREDRHGALDAVISVKVSSAMVGGAKISRLAETLEACIRSGDFPAGRALLGTVACYGSATVTEIRTRYSK